MSPRCELLLVGAFLALNIIIPLAIGELYPFSHAPMFADAPRRYCEYSVTGPNGETLRLVDFGLHRRYNGNPPVGTGFLHPQTIDEFGTVPTMSEVEEWVAKRLAERPEPFVVVRRQVIAPQDDGGIGPVAELDRTIRVTNPKAAP